MEKRIVITASILGFLGVLFGAFAAHGLKAVLTAQEIISFQTGVRYQFYHAFLLLFVGNTTLINNIFKKRIYLLTLVGVVFFSGSIYVLTLDEYIIGHNLKKMAIITPIGGTLLLGAWASLLLGLLKKTNTNS